MLSTFVRIEVAAFLIGSLAAIGFQSMTGRIQVKGLLSDSAADGQIRMGRIQLLVFMVWQAGTYLGLALANPHRFPDVPAGFVLAYAGSNAAYLAGKSGPLLRRLLGKG